MKKTPLYEKKFLQKLRKELLTLNGEEAEAADHDSEEDEKGTIHKMLGRKYCIQWRLANDTQNIPSVEHNHDNCQPYFC